MSYIAASAAFLSLVGAYMGMEAAKEKGRLEGAEYDKTAEETLLTGKWFIGKKYEEGFVRSRYASESATDAKSLVEREGTKNTGKTVAVLGASGVKMTSGTAAQAIIKSGLDKSAAILQNQEALDTALADIQYQTEGAVEKVRIDTIMKYRKLKRMADLARKGANAGQYTAMIGGMVNSANTYKNLGGDFKEFQSTDSTA